MTLRARWPVDDRVRARIARRYFVDQATKVEIGAEFGLTRFQVARVVQEVLDDGTVTITVRGPEHVDEALSDRLARHFGLLDALVAEDLAGAGHYVVSMLATRVADGDVLAVDWNPVVEAALSEALLRPGALPRCAVVQARGVAGLADHNIELVKRIAATCGGDAYPLYAPFLARSAADAAALRAHPLVGVATARFDRVAAAVLGVESLPSDSGLWAGSDAAAALAAAGAVAAVGPVPVTASGEPCVTAADERVIGLSAGQVQRAPFVMVTGTGAPAVTALRAALQGDLVHAVVTDVATAAALLER